MLLIVTQAVGNMEVTFIAMKEINICRPLVVVVQHFLNLNYQLVFQFLTDLSIIFV